MSRGFEMIPLKHRVPSATRATAPEQNRVARELLEIADNRLLRPRLDGKTPILEKIIALMYCEDSPDYVRRLTFTVGTAELLRILDFDNRQGFKHFGLMVNPAIPDPKVLPLLKRLRAAFGAAARILESREGAMIVDAVDSFLNTEMNITTSAGPGQDPSETPEIEDQRYRLTDLRADQIIM